MQTILPMSAESTIIHSTSSFIIHQVFGKIRILNAEFTLSKFITQYNLRETEGIGLSATPIILKCGNACLMFITPYGSKKFDIAKAVTFAKRSDPRVSTAKRPLTYKMFSWPMPITTNYKRGMLSKQARNLKVSEVKHICDIFLSQEYAIENDRDWLLSHVSERVNISYNRAQIYLCCYSNIKSGSHLCSASSVSVLNACMDAVLKQMYTLDVKRYIHLLSDINTIIMHKRHYKKPVFKIPNEGEEILRPNITLLRRLIIEHELVHLLMP